MRNYSDGFSGVLATRFICLKIGASTPVAPLRIAAENGRAACAPFRMISRFLGSRSSL
jgi:hypothetical protein